MKIEESPLDVLSRAASIVQSEEKSTLLQVAECDDMQSRNKTLGATSHRQGIPKRSLPKPLDQCLPKKMRYLRADDKLENIKDISKRAPPPPPPYIFSVGTVRKLDMIPPQLTSSAEKSKYSTLPPPYSTYFPRSSVISTTPPPSAKFTEYCSNNQIYTCCKVGYCTTFSYKNLKTKDRNVISQDFELPTVDDHFRKSLGDRYNVINSQSFYEKPSSVDEHFEKALGKSWYSLEYGKCKSL